MKKAANNVCNCLNCMIEKEYSHKNMAKRLYYLVTHNYKDTSYQKSEIERFIKYIFQEKKYQAIPETSLIKKDERNYFYYELLPYDLTILFVLGDLTMIYFIKNNNGVRAYNLFIEYLTNIDNKGYFILKKYAIKEKNGYFYKLFEF